MAGFVLLLGLMFILNNSFERKEQSAAAQSQTQVDSWQHDAGIAPLNAQIPGRTEGSLPIKLITNLNTNFLIFTNHSYDFRLASFVRERKNIYQTFCHRIQRKLIFQVLTSAKNKDIR